MTQTLARSIARMEANERRREREHRRHVVTFTDAKIDPNRVMKLKPKKLPKKREYLGYPWEGPHYPFSRLVGESRTWWLPRLADVLPLMRECLERGEGIAWVEVERLSGKCEFCRGAQLEAHEACLGCSRTGRDRDPAMHPSRADLARRREASPRRDGLLGGR